MTKRIMYIPLQGIALGLAFYSLMLMFLDCVSGSELDQQSWQMPEKAMIAIVCGFTIVMIVRLTGYWKERKIAGKMNEDDIIIITLSGRGDKDVAAIARYKGINLYE